MLKAIEPHYRNSLELRFCCSEHKQSPCRAHVNSMTTSRGVPIMWLYSFFFFFFFFFITFSQNGYFGVQILWHWAIYYVNIDQVGVKLLLHWHSWCCQLHFMELRSWRWALDLYLSQLLYLLVTIPFLSPLVHNHVTWVRFVTQEPDATRLWVWEGRPKSCRNKPARVTYCLLRSRWKCTQLFHKVQLHSSRNPLIWQSTPVRAPSRPGGNRWEWQGC